MLMPPWRHLDRLQLAVVTGVVAAVLAAGIAATVAVAHRGGGTPHITVTPHIARGVVAPQVAEETAAPTAAPSPASATTPAPATAAQQSTTPSPSATLAPLPPPCAASDLEASAGSERTAYAGGDEVAITGTVRNVSTSPCLAPFECGGLSVDVHGDNGWDAGLGYVAECMLPVGWHPPILDPGESATDRAWWDQQRFELCPAPGCDSGYEVVYAPSGSYTANVRWVNGAAATTPAFTVTVPACAASDVTLSLATDRPVYNADQPVHLTATVARAQATTRTCSVTAGGGSPQLTASNGTLEVWHGCADGCPAAQTVVLGAWNRLRVHATWDQRTCTPAGCDGPRAPAGDYTVSADWGSLGRMSQRIALH